MLAAAAAAQAAVSFVSFGLPAIGPDLRRQFGLSLAELGGVLNATLLGSGLALIAAGIVVDRFGSRPAMLAGTALAVAGLVGAALAGSKGVLFGSLLVSGLGSAVVPIAGAGALFRVYPASRRGWALGVRQMAVPLGGTLSAVALPGLEAVGGVELALLVAASLVGATGIAFSFVADAGAPGRRPRLQRAFRRILRTPGMIRLLVVAAFYIVVLQALVSYTVPAAREAGLSAFAAGAAYFAVNVAAMVSRVVWGRIADRHGGGRRVRTLVEVGLVASAGAALFALALHAGPVAVVAAAAAFGFGALGWNALVYVTAGERAAPELAGRSLAVAATVVFVVSALCTPPLGAIASAAGWDFLWGMTGALALAGALVAAKLPRAAPP